MITFQPLIEKYKKDENFEEFEDKLFDEYSEIYDEYMESLENYTKLLGYPDIIQNSMEEECAAVTRGINMGGIIWEE